jgi:hypothetical protein
MSQVAPFQGFYDIPKGEPPHRLGDPRMPDTRRSSTLFQRAAPLMPELCLFGIVPIGIALTIFLGPNERARETLLQTGGIKGPEYFLLAGPLAVKLLLFGFILYLPWRACDLLLSKESDRMKRASIFGLSGIFVYGGFLMNNLGNNLLLSILSVTERSRIEQASCFLLDLDHAIFGQFTAFSVGAYAPPTILNLSVAVYLHYSTLHVVVFFLSLLHSPGAFRRFYSSFALWILLAVPMWLLFPAISPDEMFRQNILGVDVAMLYPNLPSVISTAVETPYVRSAVAEMSTIWSNAGNNTFAISTFPSFHVGGTTLLVIALYRLNWRTSFFSGPFLLFTCVGALMTHQHYAIDFLPAILLGWIAYSLADRWITSTERSGEPSPLFTSILMTQQDARALCRWLINLTTKKRKCDQEQL